MFWSRRGLVAAPTELLDNCITPSGASHENLNSNQFIAHHLHSSICNHSSGHLQHYNSQPISKNFKRNLLNIPPEYVHTHKLLIGTWNPIEIRKGSYKKRALGTGEYTFTRQELRKIFYISKVCSLIFRAKVFLSS